MTVYRQSMICRDARIFRKAVGNLRAGKKQQMSALAHDIVFTSYDCTGNAELLSSWGSHRTEE